MNRKVGIALVALFALGGVAACGGGGGGGGSTSAFCDEVKKQNAASDQSPEQQAAALDKLVSIAPSEIKGDMNTLKDFDSLASAAASDSDKQSELSAKESDITKAVGNITKFVKDKCGVDLNSSNS